jgi:type IV secretory pathway VirB4 component
LVNLYRTGRKFGVATGLVTQNVTDLERSSAGQEIISNAPIRIIHRQSETEIDGVARMLKLSEEQKTILSAVKTNEGYYSSFVIMATEHSPPVFEVAMLIPDPVQYWTFTSKPNEVTHREEETEKYQLRKYSDEQARAMAIMDLAKKYPHGLVIK